MGNIIDCCLSCQTNKLELYSLQGNFRAKVVDVYDGDTITIVIFNKFSFEKHKLRMYGYDSPEMKPKLNKENRDIERRCDAAVGISTKCSFVHTWPLCPFQDIRQVNTHGNQIVHHFPSSNLDE